MQSGGNRAGFLESAAKAARAGRAGAGPACWGIPRVATDPGAGGRALGNASDPTK